MYDSRQFHRMLRFNSLIRSSLSIQRNHPNEAGLLQFFRFHNQFKQLVALQETAILSSHLFHSFEDSYQFMKFLFSGRQHGWLHSTLSSLSALKPSISNGPLLTGKPPQLPTLSRSSSDSLPIIDSQQRLPVPTVSSATIAFAMDMVLSHLPQTLPHGRDA